LFRIDACATNKRGCRERRERERERERERRGGDMEGRETPTAGAASRKGKREAGKQDD